jgi:two-component sensor histidine kinase
VLEILKGKLAPPVRLRLPAAVALGLAAAVVSVAIRAALTPFLGGEERFVALFPALLLASYFGGLAGGLSCLFASIVADWYVFLGDPETFRLAPHEAAGLCALFISGAAVVAGVIAIRRLVASLEASREAEQLLARELLHRVKNNLAVVEALAAMSARGTGDLQEFLGRFLSRMRSLSTAQRLLSREEAGRPQVEEVVAAVLAPFEVPGRLAWSGEALRLDAQQAVALALCLHELATNAVKYGALSRSEGAVRIGWSGLDGAPASISWEESGGPPVAEPTRSGSGMRLLRRGVEADLPAEIAYAPGGLRWTARFRAQAAEPAASRPAHGSVGQEAPNSLGPG